MFKLAKLFLWIKGHGTAIAIVTTIILALGAGIQVHRANRWEKEALRLDGKLTEQRAGQDKLYAEAAKSREARATEKAAEIELRKELEDQIRAAEKEGEKAKIALAAEKLKTATLPATDLVAQINERIGDESSLTAAGLFLFTRVGTNRTLDKFKDGEFYLSEFNRHLRIIKDHETKAKSFDISLGKCEEEVATNLTGWDDCRETLATAQFSIIAEKKKGKASVWRGRKQGALWTIIIGGGLKLVGVW
jgi:hypothetical protein